MEIKNIKSLKDLFKYDRLKGGNNNPEWLLSPERRDLLRRITEKPDPRVMHQMLLERRLRSRGRTISSSR